MVTHTEAILWQMTSYLGGFFSSLLKYMAMMEDCTQKRVTLKTPFLAENILVFQVKLFCH